MLFKGQQPLNIDEFLKIIQKAIDTNNPSLAIANIDILNSKFRLYIIKVRILKKALIFFNITLDENNKYTI